MSLPVSIIIIRITKIIVNLIVVIIRIIEFIKLTGFITLEAKLWRINSQIRVKIERIRKIHSIDSKGEKTLR